LYRFSGLPGGSGQARRSCWVADPAPLRASRPLPPLAALRATPGRAQARVASGTGVTRHAVGWWAADACAGKRGYRIL